MYIAVELTSRPTIRVVSHLYSERTKGLSVSQWESTDVMAKPDTWRTQVTYNMLICKTFFLCTLMFC